MNEFDLSEWKKHFIKAVEDEFERRESEDANSKGFSAERIQQEYEQGLTDLILFVQAYAPHYTPVPDEKFLSNIISIMAANLHAQYPDDDVMQLFARLSEALVVYGIYIGEGRSLDED